MRIDKRYISEYLGTFILIFMGTGAIIVSNQTGAFGHTSIAFVFGSAVMTLIYGFGHISGAHFNPAVSIGFFINREFGLVDTIFYCVSQILGATTASFFLSIIFNEQTNIGVTQPTNGWQQSFFLELILTLILMFIILLSATHGKANKPFAGIAIGSTIAIEALVFGAISGASMNPARSIAPALISGNLDFLWIYIISTIIGSSIAVILYNSIFREKL